MIEVINPGWLSMAVDNGRYGYADIGVPSSSALDTFSFKALNYLLGNEIHTPAIEVMGNDFSARIDCDVTCAITGARVTAYLDDRPVASWKAFAAHKGNVLKIRQPTDGFRYYVGFSGILKFEKIMGSFATNLECRFGGYKGRPLIKADRIGIKGALTLPEHRSIPDNLIPSFNPPHVLRLIEGPELTHFSPKSLKRLLGKGERSWYTVSAKSNRTGLRLEGEPILFKKHVERSIISEGIMAGTVQIPGDGQPIIVLHERTIGGYARLAGTARVDLDLLAHLRPRDRVRFEMIGIEEAERLWKARAETMSFMYKNQRGG
jgi:antagonist of KipI